jgi:hypothetical protein
MKILDKNELSDLHIDCISEEVVNNGIKECEKRLHDILDAKKNLEDKAMRLLILQTALAIILTILSSQSTKLATFDMSCITLGVVILSTGIALSVFSLQVAKYGSIGSHPNNWLQNDIIANTNSCVKKINALILHSYIDRIDISQNSNNEKARFLRYSILSVVGAVISFLIILVSKIIVSL